MRSIARITAAATLAGLLAAAVGAQPSPNPPPAPPSPAVAPKPVPREASFKITDSFTAQRRPRVTVLNFENTNKDAQEAKYGDAVEAMLVTFLKRKSQFVVVERQKIDTLLSEKERLQMGMVQVAADDEAGQALLEKIDVFVLGNVTLLDIPTSQETQGTKEAQKADTDDPEHSAASFNPGKQEDTEKDGQEEEGIRIEMSSQPAQSDASSRTEKREAIQGPRIEIDAKLISRFDGRIIAAAQRNGPVACLRSIVERLGIALEQDYLRPYYGKLTVTLNEPERIRVFLTPILPEDALDEEKPPVERSTTVTIGSGYDEVESWTTDPSTYTIESLLSGWYSMRIERPGYSGIGVGNARWEVRKVGGKEIVYDRVGKVPLSKADPRLSRFVVRVDPLTTEVVDGQERQFILAKKGGSFTPLVRRQYLDNDYSRAPQRVVLLGGMDVELNKSLGTEEFADDPRCDLFVETNLPFTNYGRTYVTAGQSFDFDQFTGGELIIEDYHGETVPVGRYDMAVWEPSYELLRTRVAVRDKDDKKTIKVSLTRETAPLELEATGSRPANRTILEGQTTRHRIELPLNFPRLKKIPGVPVDTYVATTNITDLTNWARGFEIPSKNVIPPIYDTSSKVYAPALLQASRRKSEAYPLVGIKTRFGLAGRLGVLSRRPDPLASETFVDRDLEQILERLLYPKEDADEDEEQINELEEKETKTKAKAATEEEDRQRTLALLETLMAQGWQPPNAQLPQVAPAGNQTTLPFILPGQQLPSQVEPTGSQEAPKPDPFPKDPEALRRLLAERLQVIDLLVLSPADMVQLRQSPEVAAIIAQWISDGGSLFAFVSSPGDYRDVVGIPLKIETLGKKTRRFDLAPGNVPGIVQATKRKIKSKGRRQLPELTDLDRSWRVLAYTRDGKGPRIIERGTQGQGGYVVLWFDDPEAFRGRWGGTRPEVEQTRANVEEHVFRWSRDLMHTRFGGSAAEPVSRTTSSGQ